jgi:hypothetical protein
MKSAPTIYQYQPAGGHAVVWTSTFGDRRTYYAEICPTCGWWDLGYATENSRGSSMASGSLIRCRCTLEQE